MKFLHTKCIDRLKNANERSIKLTNKTKELEPNTIKRNIKNIVHTLNVHKT